MGVVSIPTERTRNEMRTNPTLYSHFQVSNTAMPAMKGGHGFLERRTANTTANAEKSLGLKTAKAPSTVKISGATKAARAAAGA